MGFGRLILRALTAGLSDFAEDFIQGSHADFGLKLHSGGMGSRDVERLMKRNGITVWGVLPSYTSDILMFTVRDEDKQKAYDLLTVNGACLDYYPKDIED